MVSNTMGIFKFIVPRYASYSSLDLYIAAHKQFFLVELTVY